GGCVEVLLFDRSGLGDWTPDPLRPRRLSYLWSDCLFSTACHESSSARLVEVCGFELNLDARAHYEIIYIFRIGTPIMRWALALRRHPWTPLPSVVDSPLSL